MQVRAMVIALVVTTFFILPATSVGGGASAEEPEGAASTDTRIGPYPTLLEIELVTISESSFALSWVTDSPADTWVEWGTTEEMENLLEDSTDTRYHLIEVTGLLPDVTYYYRIGSADSASTTGELTTLPVPGQDGPVYTTPRPLYTFAVAADHHYTEGRTASGGIESDSPQVTRAFVDDMNARDAVEFVVLLGDLVDTGTDEQYSGLASILDDMDRPFYPIAGNHDKGQSDGVDGIASLGGESWSDGGELWGLAEFGGRRCVGLDSAQYPYQTPGLVPDEQLEFMGDTLTGTGYSRLPSFLMQHHPVVLDDGVAPEIFGTDNADEYIQVVADAQAAGGTPLGMFSGHTHWNSVLFSNLTGELPFLSIAATVEYPMGYSLVNVYERGYTWSFYKISGAMQESETSRGRQRLTSPGADARNLGELSDRSFSLTIGDDGMPDIDFPDAAGGPGTGPSPGTDDSPMIQRAWANPSTVNLDDPSPVNVYAEVSDPDGLDDIEGVSLDPGAVASGPVSLLDDGEGIDDMAGDGKFSTVLEQLDVTGAGRYEMVVTVTDSDGNTVRANITLTTVVGETYGGEDAGDEGDDGGFLPGFNGGSALAAAMTAVVASLAFAAGRNSRRRGG